MTNAYKLKVELRVEAPKALDPDEVEALWLIGLTTWLCGLEFPAKVTSVEAVALFDADARASTITRHLIRYLTNTEKRTGQKWIVVERYHTPGSYWREGYDRALLRAEDGSTVRIYYREWKRCWVRGQKVLAPKLELRVANE